MRLTGIKPGDIIRAGGMHAVVIRKDRRALLVQGISNASMRRIRAAEIEAHWRRTGLLHRVPPSPRPTEEPVA